ncbi:GFA family protein [uncultured Tateyamaria sp.]|uniref:GFA family protein n=1 Tax=uncultured Tateyamaria sp. TaxID=455651 RepID=UPI0026328C0A|nr:GFA family protein [uncultured Tateyamaria sp.]
MTLPRDIEGRCMCGAVTAKATISKPIVRACHCDMCRQHTSSMFMSLAVDEGTLSFDGPVTTFRSSDWAERGFCGTCGSTLFYSTVADGARHPAAGLFADIDDVPLKLEFFSDMCPAGYALSGDHRRLTTDETIAMFTSSEGD